MVFFVLFHARAHAAADRPRRHRDAEGPEADDIAMYIIIRSGQEKNGQSLADFWAADGNVPIVACVLFFFFYGHSAHRKRVFYCIPQKTEAFFLFCIHKKGVFLRRASLRIFPEHTLDKPLIFRYTEENP